MSAETIPIRCDDLLAQLFSAATHEASLAMSRWTGGLIALELDELCEVPLEEVTAAASDDPDQLQTMIVLTLEGALGGTMVLTFDAKNGKRLAAALLQREENQDSHWNALEISALQETGNILACAYLNVINRALDAGLIPSTPLFLEDFGGSVLSQAVFMQAECADTATLCRTVFRRAGEPLDWRVYFVPSPSLRQALLNSLTTRN
jgi:chemotaxis protein CheC